MPTWSPKPPRDPDEEGGFGDFGDDFSKLLEHLQPNTIPTGWPRYRKGGSPRNWDVHGDYNFVDPSGFVQIGIWTDIPEFPTDNNVVEIGFPMRYSGRPIVIAQVGETYTTSYGGYKVNWNVTPYTYYFKLQWQCQYTIDWVKFFWLAFGPGAG